MIMPIAVDAKGNALVEFLVVTESEMPALTLDAPITHALIGVRYRSNVLLLFNKYRQNWELPGGVMEAQETPRLCAARELYEETCQTAREIVFKGLMKFHLQPNFDGPERLEWGALFAAELDMVADFVKNAEAARIVWWDGVSDIGAINGIDSALIRYV